MKVSTQVESAQTTATDAAVGKSLDKTNEKKARRPTHEEDRWLKPVVGNKGPSVDIQKPISQASKESMAYAFKVYDKISEQDADKGELFMKTWKENLSTTLATKTQDAVRIAADNALKTLVQSGVITARQAEAAHDGGIKAIHDSRDNAASQKNVTHAGTNTSSNVQGSKGAIQKRSAILSANATPAAATLQSATGSSSIQAPSGFLWKPISDSDGKLAILLPPSLSGKNATVDLVDANGNVIATSKYGGNGNGGRDHYRFGEPGGSYPAGTCVRINIPGQNSVLIAITATGERLEGK